MDAKELTSKYWKEWSLISHVAWQAYARGNDYEYDLLLNIIVELGYNKFIPIKLVKYDTMEEAEVNHDGKKPFPIICQEPKSIKSLSLKKQNFLNKFLN